MLSLKNVGYQLNSTTHLYMLQNVGWYKKYISLYRYLCNVLVQYSAQCTLYLCCEQV